MGDKGEIIIYQRTDGATDIQVKVQDETVWLTQGQLVELYQTSKSNVSEHIKHIFEEGELEGNSVVRNFRTTAAEVIYERADAQKPFMGLRVFAGKFPAAKDISVAKNYLDEDELKILNNLVSGYFDLEELSALEHRPMYMADYVAQLDAILSSGGRKVLTDAGSVSRPGPSKGAGGI